METNIKEFDKKWTWVPCVYDVKKVTNQTETVWNLTPSVSLVLPESEGNVPTNVTMSTEMTKSFIYTENIGWNWHKSWNIPDIICELDIRDPITNERFVNPPSIHAEIQVVKTAINPTQTFHLFDVGVKGNYKVDIENGKCLFTGLKFNSTSYNHEVFFIFYQYFYFFVKKHSKFHLVITVYLTQNRFELPQILISKISPPVFIDSRKSARDLNKQKKTKLQSYIDPFLPDSLDKAYIKRDNKLKLQGEEEIDSSIEGLINYFGAPNIRHKIKHPLFLAIKFYKCISLYINSNILHVDIGDKVIEGIQKVLFESYFNNQDSDVKIKLEQKPLLICIETGSCTNQQLTKYRKVYDFLEPLKNEIIEVLIDPIGIPKCFKHLNKVNELAASYKQIYTQLVNSKFNLADGQKGNVQQHKVEIKSKKYPTDSQESDHPIRKIVKIQGEEPLIDGVQMENYESQFKTSQSDPSHQPEMNAYQIEVKKTTEQLIIQKSELEDNPINHVNNDEKQPEQESSDPKVKIKDKEGTQNHTQQQRVNQGNYGIQIQQNGVGQYPQEYFQQMIKQNFIQLTVSYRQMMSQQFQNIPPGYNNFNSQFQQTPFYPYQQQNSQQPLSRQEQLAQLQIRQYYNQMLAQQQAQFNQQQQHQNQQNQNQNNQK